MIESDETRKTIKSDKTLFNILHFLKENNGARVTEISDAVGISKSTILAHLNTMRELEYVVKEGDTYYNGLRFLDIGMDAKERREIIPIIKPALQKLADKTGDRPQFLVEEHGYGVYLEFVSGDHISRLDARPGNRFPLHATAAGKAILAFLPEDKVDEIIAQRGLSSKTETTIVDKEELKDELESVREHGYAVNTEENIQGLRGIGAPVRNREGTILGAISLASPIHRMSKEKYLADTPELILGVVNEIELQIEYEL